MKAILVRLLLGVFTFSLIVSAVEPAIADSHLPAVSTADGQVAAERATGAIWRQKRVPVYDHTPPEWRPIVRDQVAKFNAMLPKRAPRLRYRSMPEQMCNTIRERSRRDGITVCPIPGDPVWFAKMIPTYDWRTFDFKRVKVQIAAERMRLYDDVVRAQTVCHELMHALTSIPDNESKPQVFTSCVHGYLAEPGPFDAQYARLAYAHDREKKKKSGDSRGNGGKKHGKRHDRR